MNQTIENYQAGQAAAINAHIAAGGTVEMLTAIRGDDLDSVWTKVERAYPDGPRMHLHLANQTVYTIGKGYNDTFTLQWRR